MKYLKLLFELKDKVSDLKPSIYKETVTDIVEANDILSDSFRIQLNIEWIENLRGTESYIGYMLGKGFTIEKDKGFILNVPIERLEELAEVYIKYRLK